MQQATIVTDMVQRGARADVADDLVANAFLDRDLTGGLLDDYICWRAELDARHNETPGLLPDELQMFLDVVGDIEDEEWPQAAEFRQIIQNAADQVGNGDFGKCTSFIDAASPCGSLAAEYLDLLLAGKRRAASSLVLHACTNGTGIADIYMHVFQPVLWEVGRRWQLNELSVGQEHYCTAATQTIMTQLYPVAFDAPRNGHSIVSVSPGENLHEVGIRMVNDLCELDGWDTHFLGSNLPLDEVVKTLRDRKPEILAISATMNQQISDVRSLAESVRSEDLLPELKVVVGGRCFSHCPDLWREIGADATAATATEAVQLLRTIVGGGA